MGYAEYGDHRGRPLIFFHGQPGNHLFRHPDESLSASVGVRLIAIDRPGYGLSDFQPVRKLLDWPGDVSELANTLGLDRFAVLGFSAGGPYALACAYQIPNRLTRIGIADSASPMHLPEINRYAKGMLRINYLLARYAPSALRLFFHIFWAYSRRNPDAFLKMAYMHSPQSDKDLISHPGFHSILEKVWKENLRRDSRGYVQEIEILMKGWGGLESMNLSANLYAMDTVHHAWLFPRLLAECIMVDREQPGQVCVLVYHPCLCRT